MNKLEVLTKAAEAELGINIRNNKRTLTEVMGREMVTKIYMDHIRPKESKYRGWTEIGRMFNRKHCTIVHNYQKATLHLDIEPQYRNVYNSIIARFNSIIANDYESYVKANTIQLS